MAGGGSSEDNPVSLNVTAMVDIIFCLCLFFMCSFHFKQLQGKIDSWLPKDVGVNAGQPDNTLLEEIRVVITNEPEAGGTVLKFGGRKVGVLAQGPQSMEGASLAQRTQILNGVGELILQSYSDYEKVGKKKEDVPVIIDAFPLVPWRDVIAIMNVCKDRGLEKIQFAAPMPTAAAPPAGG
jgi:biopolymer transport protein ExbD